MKTELIDISPTRKEIKIEIEAAEVRSVYDRVSNRYTQQATVPGFRRGHAPRAVVRQRYKNEIRNQVLREIVPQAVNDAIAQSALDVIGEPDIHLDEQENLEQLGERPLVVHTRIEVLPDVTLGQYRELEVARRVRPVSDEAVERIIADLREASASLQPVEERGAQVGDTVTVNFHGKFIDPPADEDINVEDVDVVLGGEGVLGVFTEHLLDVRPDDTREFTVKYPEDFSAKGLAGKEVAYTATVTAVRIKELPALDDEWAKSLGEEVDSLATLRERVRANLRERAASESEDRMRSDTMDKLIAAHPLEMPSKLVEHRTRRLLETTMRDMLVRGIDPRGEEINWENMSRLLRSQAEHDLRGSLLLERIADAENIEVTDEEIETEIKEIAEASRQTPEQVRAALTKQGGERSIADRLRQRKALDFIIEHAHVSDEEWREEDLKANAERAKAATESGEQATGSANSEASAGVSETEGQPLKQS